MNHTRLRSAIAIKDAAKASLVLNNLTERMERSAQFLKDIQTLLPMGLRSQIKAGPVDEETWCLLVSNNAVASKLRQMTPDLERRLRDRGHLTIKVRIKMMNP